MQRSFQGTGYTSPTARKSGDPGIGKSPGEVSETFCDSPLFLAWSEQFPVFRLRQEAIEIPQHGLFCVPVRIELLHHAATHQFRTAFIQFALFLPELFLDGTEFLLERILLLLLLLE